MLDINLWPQKVVGKYTLIVAETPRQKKQGLQFTDRLPPNFLMLFPGINADSYFHTVNCAFPLDIIPLNSKNRVLDIWSAGVNMKSVGPTPRGTVAIVEAPLGWARSQNIQVGSDLMKVIGA